ncbi:MAG: broad specificity phosphatase PhoE [Arenicella sp.]
MPTIYLVRHGQASFGQENYDQLSELGKQQASHLGENWQARLTGFDAVALGSMHRHRQTAELCLAEMGQNLDSVDAVIDSGWNEYDHQNILAQLRPELATAASTEAFVAQQDNPKQAFAQIFTDGVSRWVDGQYNDDYLESWSQFKQRIHNSLKQLIQKNSDKKNIAVFTSGGPISLISQHLLGVPEQNLMQMNWTLVNCGVTKLVATDSGIFVSTLSQHVHFEGAYKSMITYR